MNKAINTKRKISRLQKVIFYSLFSILYSIFFVTPAFAATNIDATDKWAWNDAMGWINFYSSNTVNVSDNKLTGYAVFEDTGDEISLDCETSPAGDICTTSNYFVSNDGSGSLAGWAWSDGIGWISFCGNGPNASTWTGTTWVCPASPTYQVTIDPTTDEFEGWAWNDIIGWISFCGGAQTTNCPGTVSYKVKTSWVQPAAADGWLISNTFDTGFADGVGYNSIMWIGDLKQAGNTVKFQFATSDCSNGATNAPTCDTGTWDYIGSDGTSSTDYGQSVSGSPTVIYMNHNNKQYYRYKIFLDKADGNTLSPIVEDVIINWSR